MTPRWHWLVGAAVLAGVVWRTGSGPFVAGVRALDPGTLALGAGLALVTTIACAWRWHLVARELGVAIRVPAAVAACYRAQFLNTVLPGGVLGDVHRAVLHGRSAGATGRAVRAVAWERFAGQAVQATAGTLVLLVLPSPVRSWVPWAVSLVVALVVPLLLVLALVPGRASGARASRWSRVVRAARQDVRRALLARRARSGVLVASVVAMTGHVATCLVAARAVGVSAPVSALLPLVVLVVVAAGLPLNLAGWGPREGMAAWSFAAAGLGAAHGVAMAVAFGAIVVVANLPGLALLLVAPAWSSRPRAARLPVRRPRLAAGGGWRA